MRRLTPLCLALFATSCLFGSGGGVDDPNNGIDPGMDASSSDMGVADTSGQPEDQGGMEDMPPPPIDFGVPDGGPPVIPSACEEVVPHPSFFPREVLGPEDRVSGNLSFAQFSGPQGPSAALAYLLEASARGHIFVADANGVSTEADLMLPMAARVPTSIAVGTAAGGDGFDVGIAFSECPGADGANLIFAARDGESPISGSCESTFWGLEFTGGFRGFAPMADDGAQRAVFFEQPPGGATEIVSLEAPYNANSRTSAAVNIPPDSGWIQGSGSHLVMFANENNNLFVWDPRSNQPPTPTNQVAPRHLIGFEALTENVYVIARRIAEGVEIGLYETTNNGFAQNQVVEVLDVADPTGVDVAGFPGGFAVFVQDGLTRWDVHAYAITPDGPQPTCSYEHLFSNVRTSDVELVAYRQGNDLQVLAAVLFGQGNDQHYINVEGPRWRNYYGEP